MTSFGPCLTHCGGSVGAGVDVMVSVGLAVGEEKTVAVSVG